MIFSMIKKGLVGTVLGVGALSLIFGTSAPSYVKTAFFNARSAVKGSVPIQFEIDRLRGELANLKSTMASQIQTVAREERALDGLKTEIATARNDLNRQKEAILALRDAKPTGEIRLAGHDGVSVEEIAREKSRRFDHYNRLEKIVLQKEKTFSIREQNLAQAHDQLANLRSTKLELETRLAEIEAQHKALEAADTGSCTIDSSALDRIEKEVKQLEIRITDQSRVQELNEKYIAPVETSPAATPAARNVDAEIDAKFNASVGGSAESL